MIPPSESSPPPADPAGSGPRSVPPDLPTTPAGDSLPTSAVPGATSDPGTAALTASSLVGTRLERYSLTREIGRGGMGVVYEAEDTKLQRRVALKVLPAEAADEDARARFLREARAAATLNHPNIVAIHDAGETDGRPFLVMELVDGESLDQRPPVHLDEALRIATRICDALEHAHARGLVHRDLKPGNVLIADDNESTVKLTDMGIALTRGAARVTRIGALTGTPGYMAPEQALGRDVDERADLYALGVMLYAWATGRMPFEGDDVLAVVSQHIHAPVVPPRTYRADLPAGLEPTILRLLEKDPTDRFASAAEVRDALANVGDTPADSEAAPEVTIEGLTRGRLVGRRDELARLQDLWAGTRDGGVHLALVSGEPGVGKTRLAHEILAAAQLEGALALSGGCYENEATTPYLPFLEAFRRVAHESADDRLADALGDTAPEIARLAPEIEARLGPFPERPHLSPQEERLRLFDAVARFLGRLGAGHGLVFFLDDLQWADHGSLALLHYLLRQLGSGAVLFLGTYREVELDRTHALSKALVDWNREKLATRVRLGRLDLETTKRMIATLLGQQEVSGEFAESLFRETEGNPFFLEEILKALIAEGDIVHEGTEWHRKTTSEFILPQSVKAAIGNRLETVGDTCTDVLRTAAVLGKVFAFRELLSVAQPTEDELLDALDEAAAAQLIAARSGETFAFTHDKIREVLYDELNPIRRRRLHARIAEGLEKLAEKGGNVAVEELAHHFVEGGNVEAGLGYSERAADAARAVFAWDEALAMLERAYECAEALDRPDDLVRLDEQRGDVAHARGDLAIAAGHFEQALASARDEDHRHRIRAKLGEIHMTTGDPRGREHVRTVLENIDAERLPGLAGQAMMVEARYRHLEGDLAGAVALYRRALPLVEAGGDTNILIRITSYLAGSLQHRAEYIESNACAQRSIAIGEEHGDPEGVLLGLEFQGENAFCVGDWKRSEEILAREEALAAEIGAGGRFAWTCMRALAIYVSGRTAEGLALFKEGIERARRVGDLRLEYFLDAGLGGCLADVGRVEEGRPRIERVLRAVDEAGLNAHRMIARLWWAPLAWRLGRREEALTEARTGIAMWLESESHGMGIQIAPYLAEVLVQAGELDEARVALDRHLEIAARERATVRIAQNQRVRALLEAAAGRSDEALRLVDEAIATFEAEESRLDLARALGNRAAIRAAAGDAGGADTDRAAAFAILEECGADPAAFGLGD